MIDEKKLIERIHSEIDWKYDENKSGKDKYHDGMIDGLEIALDIIKREQKLNEWIPCSERMPDEHASIFAKFRSTDKWNSAMFEKVSDDVNVTIEYEDGTRKTATSRTLDGKWKIERERKTFSCKVIAWQPLPEKYEVKENE